ncbi:MAG: hypothetical protein AMXMBFR13_50070 [Phycisphaerae bacterium]
MYPNNLSRVSGQAGYVPYFYESGRFLTYPLPSAAGQELTGYRAPPAEDSLRGHSYARGLDRIQTVEDVIMRGYFSVPGGDPVTALISDKKHTSRFGLDDVISQIRNRYVLYNQNMKELDESICEANNGLFRQVAAQGTPADNRQQYSANKAIQGVYEQKRMERQNLWRDVSRLRLALPESAQQYLTAYRKVSALESYRGDNE